jgi:hypothetical protein
VLNEPSLAVMRRLGLTEFARWDDPRIPAGNPLRPRVTYRRERGLGSRIQARFQGLEGDLELPERSADLPRAAEFDR